MLPNIYSMKGNTVLLSLLLLVKNWQPVPRKVPSDPINHTSTDHRSPLVARMPAYSRGSSERTTVEEQDSWKEFLLYPCTEDRSSGLEGSGAKVS